MRRAIAPGTPALDRLRHWLALPLWCPAGARGRVEPTRHWLDLPLWYPAGACSRRWRLCGR